MAEMAKDAVRDMQRRTRRSASTIGGAAPDTIIGRAAADRAGARPYTATRCENASKSATAGSRRRPILNATTSPLYERRGSRGSASLPCHTLPKSVEK